MTARKDLSRRDLFGLFRRSVQAATPPAPSAGPAPAPSAEPAPAPTPQPTPAATPVLRPPLRPPGAPDEARLVESCLRCGACVQACPRQAIQPLPAAYGGMQGTPYIVPREAPCVMCHGLLCTTACPSGTLLPLSGPAAARMGLAVVDPGRCLPHLDAGACDLCQEKCPIPGAIMVDTGGRPHVTAQCVGCGLCEHYCPTEPAAIRVTPTAALDEDPR